MKILITGTPGTGKTTLSKRLCKDLHFFHIEINKLVKERGWHDGYDRSTHSYLVDEAKIRKELSLFLRRGPEKALIDTHLINILGKKQASTIIVCTCDLKRLNGRLKARRYPLQKIKDNLEAEAFEVCKTDASHRYGRIIIYDSTDPIKEAYPKLLRQVKKALDIR